MATMAQWGDIKFAVNSERIFSFRGMKRSYSARWATHNIIGKRPMVEFQGPDLDEISIEVKNGKVAYFYVGGKKVAVNKFRITSGTENWNEIWNQGELVRATAQITFKEYT